MQHETLLTVEETCRRLALSRSKLYQLFVASELPSLHIGRSRRIPASAVDAYIERLLAEASANE